jgi:hypothetical protein
VTSLIDPSVLVRLMETTMAGHGVAVRYVESLPLPDKGVARSRPGEVELRQDLRPAVKLEVLIHEFAHELLHGRDAGLRNDPSGELEALGLSYEVSRALGLALTDEERALLQRVPDHDRIRRLAKDAVDELRARRQELGQEQAAVEEEAEEQNR